MIDTRFGFERVISHSFEGILDYYILGMLDYIVRSWVTTLLLQERGLNPQLPKMRKK